MLFVLLNWGIILITAYCTGFAGMTAADRIFHYRVKKAGSCLVAGLVGATVYAQFFSLFWRVSWEAMLIWCVFSLISVILLHRQMEEQIRTGWKSLGTGRKIFLLGMVLLIAYFTSRGTFISDTNLYHAQSIRWIEEYGVLKGLGNIQSRASYNSSFFCLSALYSMKYLFGQSMHAVQGLMACILAASCMDIACAWKRKRPVLSDFARVGAIYYLTLLYQELMSPSSDFAVMIILFWMIIRWLELLEAEEESEVPYALLCIAGVYTVTLKLTAGLILILLVRPLGKLIREKKWRNLTIYFITGLFTALPFLIRNVIISGWLLYPFTGLDLFQVDWKVPRVIADADAFQIKSWGKGIHEYGMYEALPTTWIPNWFRTMLSATERLLLLADAAALCIILVWCIRKVLHGAKTEWSRFLVMITVSVSFLFWLLSAPLTRYGYVYILLLPLITGGEICLHILWGGSVEGKDSRKRWKTAGRMLLICALAGLLIWKGAVLLHAAYAERSLDSYIHQTDYDNNEGDPYVKEFKIHGITYYYGVSGYHRLPGGGICFAMRGTDIRDGFRYEEHSEQQIFGKKVRP